MSPPRKKEPEERAGAQTAATVEVQAVFAVEFAEPGPLTPRQVEDAVRAHVEDLLRSAGADVRSLTFYLEAHQGLKSTERTTRPPTDHELALGAKPGEEIVSSYPQVLSE